MMKASLRYIPAETARNSASPDTWGTIFSAPTEPLTQPLNLDEDYVMGAVLESTCDRDHPFKLVGNYEVPGTTTVQIPGWR